jgi:hypothetical protein
VIVHLAIHKFVPLCRPVETSHLHTVTTNELRDVQAEQSQPLGKFHASEAGTPSEEARQPGEGLVAHLGRLAHPANRANVR